MRKVIVSITTMLIVSMCYSQAPQAFKYQAVARDSLGSILKNQNISVRISILSGSTTGSVEYSETHTLVTNQFGLFNLSIGSGALVSGNFSSIDWGNNSHFVKIDLDATGGSNYQHMGTSQLLSVPYALFSEKAGNVVYSDTSAKNEIQILSIHNDTMHITNGNFVKLDIDRVDRDSTNELQGISISNDTIFLSGGGFVKLPSNYSGSGNTGISGNCGSILTLTCNVFSSIVYTSTTNFSSTESMVRIPMPNKGYITNFHIYPGTNPDTGSSMTATLMKNGVQTSLSVSHSSSDGMIVKYDTITRVNINRGDLISVKLIPGTVPPNALYNFSLEFKCYRGHSVGELYEGGIIFHIYKDSVGTEHGLIVSLNDLSQSAEWGLNGTDVSNCESTWNGQANTNSILSAGGSSTHAAGICDSFNGGGFTDWYLPSLNELDILNNNIFTINKALSKTTGATEIGFGRYWSSTEKSDFLAYQYWINQSFSEYTGKNLKQKVRAIRAF